jgi:hypothetical protein
LFEKFIMAFNIILKGVTTMKKFLTAVLAIGLIGMAGLTFATAKTISEDTVASSQAKSGEMETQEYAGFQSIFQFPDIAGPRVI